MLRRRSSGVNAVLTVVLTLLLAALLDDVALVDLVIVFFAALTGFLVFAVVLDLVVAIKPTISYSASKCFVSDTQYTFTKTCLNIQTFKCYTFPMPVHNHANKKIVEFLRQLKLSTDEIDIYLYLLQTGQQTVVDISRGLQTGRTKLYPLLEGLGGKQLIIISERHYGTSYRAAAPESLSLLVDKQEQLSHTLRTGLPTVVHLLEEIHQSSPTTSKIIEYHALDGVKQIYWNLRNTETDFFILELPEVTKQIGKHLKNKLRPLLTEKQLTGHVLTNQKNPNPPTRYLDRKIFEIEFETYVYNNVVSLISYQNNTFYGVEIHNSQSARQYMNLLSVLWRQAIR